MPSKFCCKSKCKIGQVQERVEIGGFEVYNLHMRGTTPTERITIILSKCVSLADLIRCAQYDLYKLRGVQTVRCQFPFLNTTLC